MDLISHVISSQCVLKGIIDYLKDVLNIYAKSFTRPLKVPDHP